MKDHSLHESKAKGGENKLHNLCDFCEHREIYYKEGFSLQLLI